MTVPEANAPQDPGPSLEGLVEAGLLQLDSLHPGGLDTTREMAERCGIGRDTEVLDVACGTGETACYLAETFGARVHGIDQSEDMIRRAEAKARERNVSATFERADAMQLPFSDAELDVVICECTLCYLEKDRALGEMVRVLRPGGRIGMHDLAWREGATEKVKQTLAEIEGERPETIEGWKQRFVDASLVGVEAIDKSAIMSRWMKDSRRQMGPLGQVLLSLRIVRRWGPGGLWKVLRSERVFSSGQLGYAIVVGTKP